MFGGEGFGIDNQSQTVSVAVKTLKTGASTEEKVLIRNYPNQIEIFKQTFIPVRQKGERNGEGDIKIRVLGMSIL